MYYLEQIDASNWTQYAHLIPGGRTFNQEAIEKCFVARMGVALRGESVGAAVAKPNRFVPRSAVISSCAVKPGQRRVGVGSTLLTGIEARLRDAGFSSSVVWMMEDDARRTAMEAFLLRNGWPPSEPQAYFCRTNFDLLSSAPFMRSGLAGRFEKFHWTAHNDKDRAIIRDWLASGVLPAPLNPLFLDRNEAMPPGSIGIRRDGVLAGWCTAYSTGPDSAAVQSLFAHPSHGGGPLAVAVLAEGIRMTPGVDYLFHVGFDRVGMVRFLERRMRPYLSSVRRAFRSSKCLQ